MQSLFDLASGLNVEIVYANLEMRDGEYRHDLKRIRLREGMAMRLHRSVLAHELGHAWYADVPQQDRVLHAKQERRADEWAALRLIDPVLYEEVEQLRGGHAPSMAHDLGVITRLVEAYQRVLERDFVRVA